MLKLLLFLQQERFHLYIHRRPSALLQLKYLLQCLRSLPRFNSCPVISVSVQFSVCCRPSVLPQLQHLLQCMLSLPTSMLVLYKCFNLRWSSIGLYQSQASSCLYSRNSGSRQYLTTVTRTHRLLLQPRRHIQVQSWSNRWLCNHLKISIDEYMNIAYNYYA